MMPSTAPPPTGCRDVLQLVLGAGPGRSSAASAAAPACRARAPLIEAGEERLELGARLQAGQPSARVGDVDVDGEEEAQVREGRDARHIVADPVFRIPRRRRC